MEEASDEIVAYSQDGVFAETESMEDFEMPTHSRVSALNFYGGNTLTYSAYPDFYEYRVLSKDSLSKKWEDESYGPFIDRTVDDVFVCTGIHYIDMYSGAKSKKSSN